MQTVHSMSSKGPSPGKGLQQRILGLLTLADLWRWKKKFENIQHKGGTGRWHKGGRRRRNTAARTWASHTCGPVSAAEFGWVRIAAGNSTYRNRLGRSAARNRTALASTVLTSHQMPSGHRSAAPPATLPTTTSAVCGREGRYIGSGVTSRVSCRGELHTDELQLALNAAQAAKRACTLRHRAPAAPRGPPPVSTSGNAE